MPFDALRLDNKVLKLISDKAKESGRTIAEEIALAIQSYTESTEVPTPVETDVNTAEYRRNLLKQALTGTPKQRLEKYIEAQATIPEELAPLAKELLEHGGDSFSAHYENGPSGTLIYIPAGFERYKLTSEYWWPLGIETDPALQEGFVQRRILEGLDELEVRRRLATMLANPPKSNETGITYYARIHKCSPKEALERIVKGI